MAAAPLGEAAAFYVSLNRSCSRASSSTCSPTGPLAWRATAIYTKVEVERLISDRLIPEDRRVLYARQGVTGLRHGEAASLRWRQYDATQEPLGGHLP
jgi:integrase